MDCFVGCYIVLNHIHTDNSDVATENDTEKAAGNVAVALMKNPQMLAAVQGGLNNIVGMPSGYIARYVLTEL